MKLTLGRKSQNRYRIHSGPLLWNDFVCVNEISKKNAKFFSFPLGKSKRASALVAAVEKATDNFIERGEQIANENPDIKQEMLEAVDEVRKHGNAMSSAAREFSEDPCSSLKRGNMVRASRSLLSAVTRLLILADMVDVHLLLKSLHVVEDDLSKLQNASSQDELLNNMKVCLRLWLFL